MKKFIGILSVAILITINSVSALDDSENGTTTEDAMLIVLNVPSIDDEYYAEVFDDIIDFQANYSRLIRKNKDLVIVICDERTMPIIEHRFSDGVLIEATISDIWMRDFSTANPFWPVQFRYSPAAQGGSETDAYFVQDEFNLFAKSHNLDYSRSTLILDGGNIVDSYKGKIVVTDRFLTDNRLSKYLAKDKLRHLLNVDSVAIIPNDDPNGLAHADGMLMFLSDEKIILNQYPEPFRSSVINELLSSFPDIEIIEIPVEANGKDYDERFVSACGINVNAVVTNKNIYLPHFGRKLDELIVRTIQSHTKKIVVSIKTRNICAMGGSVRCLSWQVTGKNANKLLRTKM